MLEQRHNRNIDGLHFTIGSVAGHGSAKGLDLREDLALVKAALFYADSIKLCIPGASVLSGIVEFQEASTEAQARLVVRFLPDLQPSTSPQEIHFFEAAVGLRGTREKRRISKRTRKKILAMVTERQKELEAMVVEQHQATGIEGFREAVRLGVLEVHPFRSTSAEAVIEAKDGYIRLENPLRAVASCYGPTSPRISMVGPLLVCLVGKSPRESSPPLWATTHQRRTTENEP